MVSGLLIEPDKIRQLSGGKRGVMKILENRWVEFLVGCGVLYAAYHESPRTTAEALIAIAGGVLGALFLILSWYRDQEFGEHQKRRSQ